MRLSFSPTMSVFPVYKYDVINGMLCVAYGIISACFLSVTEVYYRTIIELSTLSRVIAARRPSGLVGKLHIC